jgi:hypothetical protein
MIRVLSIDLDAIWDGEDTIYLDPEKKLNPKMLSLILSLNKLPRKALHIGIDHHMMCLELDKFIEPYEIDHIDAHHDLYAEGYYSWLNPLFIRAKRVNIGNFLFQLLRERSLAKMTWLIPDTFDQAQSKLKVIKNIGVFYAQKVDVKNALFHKFNKEYDLVFISLSVEWIPEGAVKFIEEILINFELPRENIKSHLNAMHKRWDCKDDEKLTQAERFYFKCLYKVGQ